jgi:hypothetical protein
MRDGKLIASSDIVGTGKTTILQKSRSCSSLLPHEDRER